MPFAVVDGIRTRYEVLGDGEPLLMFSPGGFNATIENWRTFSIYTRLRFLEHLPRDFACIVFDKRESGESGGRLQPLTFESYVAQGLDLLNHLGIKRVHLMGGCIGCSIAAKFAQQIPSYVNRMVLYSPAGGLNYRRTQLARFTTHAHFVRREGLGAVVALARREQKTFAQEPRLGPWASVIRRDDEFAAKYAAYDVDLYLAVIDATAGRLFDTPAAPLFGRIDVPGGQFDVDARTLIVPGGDANHPPDVARHLAQSLPHAELWDVPPEAQTEETAPPRVREFLQE